MSLNVLVIPEDFRQDQYILKPVLEAILDMAGKPNAKVRVCQDPLLLPNTHASVPAAQRISKSLKRR